MTVTNSSPKRTLIPGKPLGACMSFEQGCQAGKLVPTAPALPCARGREEQKQKEECSAKQGAELGGEACGRLQGQAQAAARVQEKAGHRVLSFVVSIQLIQ